MLMRMSSPAAPHPTGAARQPTAAAATAAAAPLPLHPPPPSFSIAATDGKARAGVISTRHGSIETPAALLYTRRGNPQNLTPDMVARLQPQPQAYQLDAMQFLQQPSPDVLRQHGGGAHGYLALNPGIPVVATQRDPTMYSYGVKPSTDAGAYVTIHSGGAVATPDVYMAVVSALQPDLWVTLCDEAPGDARGKRAKQAVDRTSKWLEACLSWQPSDTPQQTGGAEGGAPNPSPGASGEAQLQGGGLAERALAAVAGAGVVEERARAAKAVADKAVAGFALCGFGTGELPEQRPALIQACLEHLPSAKPRLISGLASPVEVLEGVALGLDLFDDSYVLQASSLGYALCFPHSPPEPGASAAAGDGGAAAAAASGADAVEGSDGTKLNLWSPVYRLDKRPLLPGCKCHACARHTRAYVHHLLQANEMLAEVLLELHNTHHYLLFMASVREAVRRGRLQAYAEWFEGRADAAWSIEVAGPQPAPQGSGGQAGATGAKRWTGASKPAVEEAAPKRPRT